MKSSTSLAETLRNKTNGLPGTLIYGMNIGWHDTSYDDNIGTVVFAGGSS